MFPRFVYTILIILLSGNTWAQIVTISPSSAGGDDQVAITFDAALGNAGLKGAEKVYMHSGVITTGPQGMEWEYVIGNWGEDDSIGIDRKSVV